MDLPYQAFMAELKQRGFGGDIHTDLGARIALATDNSLYQKTPQIIIFPKHHDDIVQVVRLASSAKHKNIKLTARGGGTSTCGQALNEGIIIDCSKWLHHILDINIEQGYVIVQPGVILDQLNQALDEYNMFFPVEISTSSRATLGGMFNTNACGIGACLYGRFGEHVLESRCILSDGSVHHAKEIPFKTFEERQCRHDKVGQIYTQLSNIATERRQKKQFTHLSRGMSGYDLDHLFNTKKRTVNPNRLLAGAEGTLCIVSELKLAIQPKPNVRALFAIAYDDFLTALDHAQDITPFAPSAIETVDHHILTLAKTDEIYPEVNPLFNKNFAKARALTLVEFVANSQSALVKKTNTVTRFLQKTASSSGILDVIHTEKASIMQTLWTLRKKGVGLLGTLPGRQRPAPFIEDTAVPPQHLANYIRELIALLDKMKLDYGIFGHVDAGCLHVRPALDMTNPDDRAKVKQITDHVSTLLKKYQGVLWAEHGKGYRSQYTESFVGSTQYRHFRRIKTAFDPKDTFNPGKIATSLEGDIPLVNIEHDFRGKQDQQILPSLQEQSGPIMHCNGNGACFNMNTDESMCPSYKFSKDRSQSPKGRAALIREWLRQLSNRSFDLNTHAKRPFSLGTFILRHLNTNALNKNPRDFSQTVFKSLETCLGCKACASSCPIKVNIPKIKSTFLAHYYTRYRRPLKDFILAHTETMCLWQNRLSLLHPLINGPLTKYCLKKIGLVDLPEPKIKRATRKILNEIPVFSLNNYDTLSETDKANTVILVQDVFTRCFEHSLIISTYQLLKKMGFNVFVHPLFKSGKPLYVKGFIHQFQRNAKKQYQNLSGILARNIPLIGIEPSMSLTFRDEYRDILGDNEQIKVWLLQEWLAKKLTHMPALVSKNVSPKENNTYYLLSHCSEKALHLSAEKEWQQIFKRFGLTLNPLKVGCCGMAGAFGHETEHQNASKGIYALSWQTILDEQTIPHANLLATGFSCRSQVRRCSNITLQHPIDILSVAKR